ncbi:hypothetical protein BJ742DRAFT_849292 [Cladochytrium replicatum]|nr:hypothetical protein BJ742DRAFT_849292 [Cladochytrium replicatum]
MDAVTASTSNGQTPPRSGNAAKNRTCRNIIIHGYCKFEGKGCEYNHDAGKLGGIAQQSASPELGKSKLRVDSPVFLPGQPPDSMASTGTNANFGSLDHLAGTKVAGVQSYDPSYGYYDSNPYEIVTPPDVNGANRIGSSGGPGMDAQMMNPYYQHSHVDPYFYQHVTRNPGSIPMTVAQPLQYHLYIQSLPYVSNLHPNQKSINAFFMSDRLREELQCRNEAVLQSLDPSSPEAQRLPPELHVYHSFFPLEDLSRERSTKVFGFTTAVYKATSAVDGKPYLLRRIESFRLVNEAAMSGIEQWRKIRHANIVCVREAFTTKAFGDNSLVFVYDYHPLSSTLLEKHLSQSGHPMPPVPEKIIWSYVTQLASALKTIHAAGLAARVLEPSKILVTNKNRIRLNCCGIPDMITFDGTNRAQHYQQEDLLKFGQLILALAAGTLSAINGLPKSLEYIGRNISLDLKTLIAYLLGKPTQFKNIDDVITMIGPRILHEINSAHHYNDLLEADLGRELENGRIVRLLCKLGFINERPEFELDPHWSETGDRYLLKLFRDYVFHQVDENGNSVVDMAHVMACLNKLDAGVEEKIMLMSRDEQSCLIVSYKELKQCIENTFLELVR